MNEMIELAKHQSNLPAAATQAKVVKYRTGTDQPKLIFAGPAQFGRELINGFSVTGQLIVAEPIKACATSENAKEFWGKIVLVERGDCMFVGKFLKILITLYLVYFYFFDLTSFIKIWYDIFQK